MAGKLTYDVAPQSMGRQGLTLLEVDPRELRDDPENIRGPVTHNEALYQLAVSIRNNGLLQPILARRSQPHLIVVAGHRRRAAAILGGVYRVPVLIRRDMLPDAVLEAMLAENTHREDLDPIEEARAMQTLLTNRGMSVAELSKRLGKSQPTINVRLALLKLKPADQEKVRAGAITLARAYDQALRETGVRRHHGEGAGWHFGTEHPLAALAEARCARAEHGKNRRVGGGVACGACWEAVIRSDALKDARG